MGVNTLHIFNPEHDLALAVGSGPYSPPAKVVELKKEMALLPAYFAGDSDFILIPDYLEEETLKDSPYFDNIRLKHLNIIKDKDIPYLAEKISKILPWGWDHAIRNELIQSGISTSMLPSEQQIEGIRNLSHRRTIIPFRESISSILGIEEKITPVELFSVEEVNLFLEKHPLSFFKAPWSSSGRGIVVSDHITHKGLMEWSHGIIRRQGSIIAEPTWKRRLDFATEWIIKDKDPIFIGYSVFETSSRGKYHGNIKATQKDLLRIIQQEAPSFNSEAIEAQRKALEIHVAPTYSGPLGIDMLSDTSGDINYCVEINLRLTMGIIEILKESPSLLNYL